MAPAIEYRHAFASADLVGKVLLLSMACAKILIHKEGLE
jgi:hypothetical protein